jgi:excisionase family DNA binding protein
MSVPTDVPDDLLSLREAAELVRVRVPTMRRWVCEGRLRGWRRGCYYLVSKAEVMGMLEPVGALPAKKSAGAVDPLVLSARALAVKEELRRAGFRV